jgi:endonuclease G
MASVLEPPAPPRVTGAIAEESRDRLSQMPDDMRNAAQRAIEKGLIDPARFGLAGRDLGSPLETVGNPVGLEAIVLLTGRPPMLVRNGRVVIDEIARNAMGTGTGLPTLNPGRIANIEGFIPSIGRVEFINHRQQWGGTGWVIEGAKGADRRWVVTNRHVAKAIAQRVHGGGGTFLRSPAGALYGAKIDMAEEYGGPIDGGQECRVEKILFLADDTEADCALFEIVISATCRPAPLPLGSNRAQPGELVATVGYPAYDSRNEEAPMRKYFGDIYNVKRFAPGLVTQSEPGLLLMHDCTTLGGNSGSPLISLEQNAVVGLHFSGTFASGNSAVSVETLRQLQTGRLFAVSSAGATPGEAVKPEAADRVHQPADLAGRGGYSASFLGGGLKVPLPRLRADITADLARPSDGTARRPYELRYTHFGCFHSKSRKTARFTAVNMDGARARKVKRASPDLWFYDLRIDRALQLGQDFFPGDLDRGHLVRREDPNWGSLAQQANDDTFHYTNCGLQHAGMNRSKALWQGLENYILDSARTQGFRACVFTGPILANDDPALGMDDVLIPREYWKVVVMPKAGGGLHATAYLLSQGDLIRKLLEERGAAGRGTNEAPNEGFELGPYRTFQIAIRHIEQATGLNWPALASADPLADTGTESVSPIVYSPLESGADLIL